MINAKNKKGALNCKWHKLHLLSQSPVYVVAETAQVDSIIVHLTLKVLRKPSDTTWQLAPISR